MTLYQIESMALFRNDLTKLLTETFGYKFKIIMLNYYELINEYGCSIEVENRIYYARSGSCQTLADKLRGEVRLSAYVLENKEEPIILSEL